MSVLTDSVGFKIVKGILVVVIPILFILTFAFLFLKIAGFNVKDEISQLSSHIPFVSHSGKSVKQSGKVQTDTSEAAADLQNQIKQLNKDMETKDQKIDSLTSQINDLQQQLQDEKEAHSTATLDGKAKTISQVYQNMDPSKAAAILGTMKDEDAANYLNMMNNTTKAKILEQMEADKAAKITPLLTAPQETEDKDNQTSE